MNLELKFSYNSPEDCTLLIKDNSSILLCLIRIYMFKQLKRISLIVSDIQKASEWYSTILNSQPVYSSPIFVLFKINNSEITLFPGEKKTNNCGVIVYWEVEDTDEALKLLRESGASVLQESRTVLGTRIAIIADPFGNVLGLTSEVTENKKSLKDQPSDSAMTTVFCRAVSAADEREEIKGPDFLAHIFLPEESKIPLKDPAARQWVLQNILRGGAYEYFIARTAYVDKLFLDSVNKNIPQVVFLGAGYDTRAYRFNDCIRDTIIFEMDSKATQDRKLRLLKLTDLQIHNNVKFIPIDFESESIQERLISSGYRKELKTLFIWEGVTYYLHEEPVIQTLKFIRNYSPSGSILFFDYMLYSEERHNRPEIKSALERMKALYKAESLNFTVEEGKILPLLDKYGFDLIQEMMTMEMEDRYLRLKDGSLSGKIIDLFAFVTAEVK
jgi:methyltransferase (TIGR00027 family)